MGSRMDPILVGNPALSGRKGVQKGIQKGVKPHNRGQDWGPEMGPSFGRDYYILVSWKMYQKTVQKWDQKGVQIGGIKGCLEKESRWFIKFLSGFDRFRKKVDQKVTKTQ